MCGRFTISISENELRNYLKESFDIEEAKSDFELPRYNVAPGQPVISIINDGKKNRVGLFKWGLVPPFAKDEKIGNNLINAKSETLMDKPSFKPSFQSKRCVILANGFYEWRKEEKGKTPMHILMTDHSIFPMAGLWSTYTKDDGSKLHTTTIITTSANELVSSIHDRMPVILTEESRKIWLNPSIKDFPTLQKVLTPYDANKMKAYRVSSLVNTATNDSIECIKEV
jgi:putative SOS response-associated peptidase YedK